MTWQWPAFSPDLVRYVLARGSPSRALSHGAAADASELRARTSDSLSSTPATWMRLAESQQCNPLSAMPAKSHLQKHPSLFGSFAAGLGKVFSMLHSWAFGQEQLPDNAHSASQMEACHPFAVKVSSLVDPWFCLCFCNLQMHEEKHRASTCSQTRSPTCLSTARKSFSP